MEWRCHYQLRLTGISSGRGRKGEERERERGRGARREGERERVRARARARVRMNNTAGMLRALEWLMVFQSGCIPPWGLQTCLHPYKTTHSGFASLSWFLLLASKES